MNDPIKLEDIKTIESRSAGDASTSGYSIDTMYNKFLNQNEDTQTLKLCEVVPFDFKK